MGSVSSIFYGHFDQLFDITSNHRKAVFLDKCIYWWQVSKYTLGDNKIWFTRSISEIAKELCLSERTIGRYLRELVELGLLERLCKLSASNKNSTFKVTKRLYIRVTDKLLKLLQEIPSIAKKIKENAAAAEKNCTFLTQDVRIEKDNLSESIYKVNNYNNLVNNTVSDNVVEKKVKTSKVQTLYPRYEIEKLIGDRIDERTKNYIKGMMANLQSQHQIQFSSPEQTFAEIVFTLTNQQQLKNVTNLTHKIQIIAKLMRQKRWLTPKGFYNHADYGSYFKTEEINACQADKPKTTNPSPQQEKQNLLKQKQTRLNEIYRLLASEQRCLNDALRHKQTELTNLLTAAIKRRCEELEREAMALALELDELKEKPKPTPKQKAPDPLQETNQLNELEQEAEQIRTQVNEQFEAVCLAIQTKPKGHKTINQAYDKYEQLIAQLKLLENKISDLEYKLFANHVA